MGLHAFLQWLGEVRVLGGVVGGGRCLAVLFKLHVAILLAIAADTAVALRVHEGAGVAERTPLELPFAKLNGAAAHAQHKSLAVVVQAVGTSTQCIVDVSKGHASGHPLFSQGHGSGGRASDPVCSLVGGQGHGWGGVVLLESVDTVIAIGGVLRQAE